MIENEPVRSYGLEHCRHSLAEQFSEIGIDAYSLTSAELVVYLLTLQEAGVDSASWLGVCQAGEVRSKKLNNFVDYLGLPAVDTSPVKGRGKYGFSVQDLLLALAEGVDMDGDELWLDQLGQGFNNLVVFTNEQNDDGDIQFALQRLGIFAELFPGNKYPGIKLIEVREHDGMVGELLQEVQRLVDEVGVSEAKRMVQEWTAEGTGVYFVPKVE